ncbi:MAG: SIS domain-containing protein [Nocardioidaceae bacterium]
MTTTTELGFDEARYLRIQEGAVAAGLALADELGAARRDGAEELVFLGTGGANLLMEPAVQLLARHSSFPAQVRRSAEEVVDEAARLGPRSIVVMPSLSGTTTETLAVAELARGRGARLVALVGREQTPLAELSHATFVNEALDDTSSESFFLQTMLGVLGLADTDGARRLGGELAQLPELLTRAKRDIDGPAAGHAAFLADADWHIFTGAGPAWTEAHYFAMCILEEMQWIRTRPVHAADFFHGTLELVDEDVSVVVLKDASAYRPMAERVEAFLADRTRRVLVLDAATSDLSALSPDARGVAGPVVLAAQLERVAAHLEILRDHPLTTRRYYKRVEY